MVSEKFGAVSIPHSWFNPSRVASWLLWLFFIAVIVTPRVLDLNLFYARDELTIWNWSDQFTQAIWRGDLSGTLITSDYPGIPLYWVQTAFLTFKSAVPGLFQTAQIPAEQLKDFHTIDLLAERRLAAGLFLSLQILAMVWLVRRLFGSTPAVLAAIILGLDPFSLSEARALRLEMVSAGFVCLSVLSHFMYLSYRRRRWLAISGIMAGLAVSSKTSAGLLVPFIWLLLLLDLLFFTPAGAGQIWLKKLKLTLINGLLWATGAIAAFWLIWPAMWTQPLNALNFLFGAGLSQAADRSVWGDKVFFWGKIIDGGDPGPFFYPVALAFRTTPLMWLGVVAALLVAVNLLARRSGQNAPAPETLLWRAPWPAVGSLLLLALALLITLELTFIISKVDRFMLIMFQPLSILTAIGLAAIIGWLTNRRRSAQKWLMAVGIAVVLAAQLSFTIPAHPYYFTYWNPLVGGGAAAMDALPIGAGEGIDLAMNFLNAQPNAEQSSMVCGGSQPWCSNIYHGQTLRFATYATGEWATADYATLYISHLQRKRYPQAVIDFFLNQPPLYRVDLQGATYAWVYKMPKIDHFAGAFNNLDGLGQLLGYTLSPQVDGSGAVTVTPGQSVNATAWWINDGAGVNNLVLRWVDQTGYEWGRGPITPRPEYAAIPPDQTAVVGGAASFTVPPETPPGQYFLRIGVTRPNDAAIIDDFPLPATASRLTVAPGAAVAAAAPVSPTVRLNRSLTPEVTLLGYSLPQPVINSQSPVWLSLFWQANAPAPAYTINLRLRDAANQTAASWQGAPNYGQYPFEKWPSGQIVKDVWALQTPPDVPVGRYTLELALLTPSGAEQNRVELGPVEVWARPLNTKRPPMQGSLDATFGDKLTLLGYNLYFDTDRATTATFAPIFYWQSQADFTGNFDIVLTLRQAQSGEALKEWREPLGKDGAKTVWKAGEIIDTPHKFATGALSGAFNLEVALVDQATGQPMPVNGQNQPVRIENIQDKIMVRVTK